MVVNLNRYLRPKHLLEATKEFYDIPENWDKMRDFLSSLDNHDSQIIKPFQPSKENYMSVSSANNFTSTKESRDELLTKLNKREQKMFKEFVKSVQGG